MTDTATAPTAPAAPAESAAFAPALIPLADLAESPFNPRRSYSDAALTQLAADIASQGILSPLLVRPRTRWRHRLDDDGVDPAYELVYGHRRLRAARIAGLTAVPCIVRAMTDTEARHAQIGENLSRADVHPIEEAEGYRALIDDGSETADTLAARYGKSRSYIYGRLTLLKACPVVRDDCLAGKIGTEVALLISRLRTEALQKQALKRIMATGQSNLGDGGAGSYRSIRNLLREEFTLSLAHPRKCMFDPDDAALLPSAGACTACPKRSGNAPEFEDLTSDQPLPYYPGAVDEGDALLCTDPDCYAEKKAAHLSAAAQRLAAQGKVIVEGAKARAALTADGTPKGAYIAAKDVKAEIAAARSAARLDSKIVPPQLVLIQDPRTGNTVEAVKQSDLVAAGVIDKAKATKPKESDWEIRNRDNQRQAAANQLEAAKRTERHVELLHRVRAAMFATDRTGEDLRMIAATLLGNVGHQDRAVLCKLWDCTHPDILRAQRLPTMPIEDVTKLVLDCCLVEGAVINVYQLDMQPDALLDAAERYGIPIDPPPAPADPYLPLPSAARAQTGGAAGARYRDPVTGDTWSGRGMQPGWLKARLAQGLPLSAYDTTATPPPAGACADQGGGAAKAQANASQTDEAGCAGERGAEVAA